MKCLAISQTRPMLTAAVRTLPSAKFSSAEAKAGSTSAVRPLERALIEPLMALSLGDTRRSEPWLARNTGIPSMV